MPREGNIVLPGRTVTVRRRWLNGRVPTPSVPLVHPVHRFAHHEIDFRRRIVTMAVVNRTPDSFYDDGAGAVLEDALAQAHAAADAGAEWVDVGWWVLTAVACALLGLLGTLALVPLA